MSDLKITHSSSTTVILTWEAHPDALNYDVWRNGVPYASSLSVLTYTDTITLDTPYVYFVRGIDSDSDTVWQSETVGDATQDTINVIPAASGTGEIDFSWTPTDGQFSYVVGTDTVVPAGAVYTAVNTDLTFSAPITLPAGRTAIEYFWDFGDGTTGITSPIGHTYIIPNLQASCVLRITDDLGDQYFCRKQLYLHVSDD